MKQVQSADLSDMLSELLNLPSTDDLCQIKMDYQTEECLFVTELDYSPEEWEDMFVKPVKSSRDALSILCGFCKIVPGDYTVVRGGNLE